MNMLKPLMMMAVLAISPLVSAQRGHSELWKNQSEVILSSLVDQKHQAQVRPMLDKLMQMPVAEFQKYTVLAEVPVVHANIGKFDKDGDLHLESADNKKLKMMFLVPAKAFNDENTYGSDLFPLYTYEGTSDAMEYNPALVYSFDARGSKDLYDIAFMNDKGQVDFHADLIQPYQPTVSNGNVPSGQQGGATGSGHVAATDMPLLPGTIYESNGQQFEVTYDENGKQTFRLLSNAGDGNVQKKKASRTETVEIEGDQDLLAQRGSAQQDGNQLPEGVIELDRTKDHLQKDANGMWVLIPKSEGPPTVVNPGKTGVIFDGQGQMVRDSERAHRMGIRRGADPAGNPTSATIEYMQSRNRFWNGSCSGQLGYFNSQLVTCPGPNYTLGANNCWIPMVGGCGVGTTVGTTYINRFDQGQKACFKQNALNASQASHAQWRAQNSYLYGGR